MERGLCGDPLGGGVYKKRLARAGAGKSGGYRVIMYYRSGERTFFIYGFAKSDMDNIGDDVLRDFKEGAKDILKLPDTQIETALKTGKLVEVI